jgi:hypothetical protein
MPYESDANAAVDMSGDVTDANVAINRYTQTKKPQSLPTQCHQKMQVDSLKE